MTTGAAAPVTALDPQVAVGSLGPLTLPSFAPPGAVAPQVAPEVATPANVARTHAQPSGDRAAATAGTGSSHKPARAPAVARQPGSDLWTFLSHLMPATPSPFTWPARMPELAKNWLKGTFGEGGKTEVAAALVAALISMIGLVTAGAALTRRRLAHLHWRARLRRYRPGVGWPTVIEAPSAGDGAAYVLEIAPGRDAAAENELREQRAKPSRQHAA